jgi:hypothetical protein
MLDGPDGTPLYLNAGSAMMGDQIAARDGESVTFKLTMSSGSGKRPRILVDGKEVGALSPEQAEGSNSVCTFLWRSDGQRHWVRAELDDAQGEPMTLTNPIYVNWGQ